MTMSELTAAQAVFSQRAADLLDLIFCLANRDNDDPLVLDARALVAAIEAAQHPARRSAIGRKP